MFRLLLASCGLLLLSTTAVLPAHAEEAPPTPAKAAFERLKGLKGDWVGEFTDGGKTYATALSYRVISDGSAVVETIFPNTAHEMMTVFYLDGDKLRLTHYCAAGNQPELVLVGTSGDELTFDFAGGSNLDPAKDGHMHALKMRLTSPSVVEEDWTYYEAGKATGTPSSFKITRK